MRIRDDKRAQCTLLRAIASLLPIVLHHAESKVCTKRSELGGRAGNLYVCSDPRLSECCEKDNSFLCCEPSWKKILLNQIWLVSTLLAIFLALVMVYVCYNRQEELFESETARQAALKLRHRAQRAYSSLWGKSKTETLTSDSAGRYDQLPSDSSRSIEQIPQDRLPA